MLQTAFENVKPTISIPNSTISKTYTADDSPACAVAPDAARFLGAIFAPTDLVHIRLVEAWDGPDGKRQSRIVPKGERWFTAADYIKNVGLWQNLMKLSAAQHANVFFGTCPRVGKSGSFEEAWQIRTARVLWSDLDDCDAEEALRRCGAARLPRPSVIVGSGNGVHLYWILDIPYSVDDVGEPLPTLKKWNDCGDGKRRSVKFVRGLDGAPICKGQLGWPTTGSKAERLKRILDGIAKAIGGDHTIDLARLLRVPGTMNRKNGRNGAASRPCVLLECEAGRRYPLGAFEQFEVQEPPAVEPAARTAGLSIGANRARLSDLSDEALLDKARASRLGDEFSRLWNGQRQEQNKNCDDWTLAKMLAFWTNRDFARTAKLFRQSGLYRPPPEKAADYPERTTRKACNDQLKGYGDGSYTRRDEAAEEVAPLAARGVNPVEDFSLPSDAAGPVAKPPVSYADLAAFVPQSDPWAEETRAAERSRGLALPPGTSQCNLEILAGDGRPPIHEDKPDCWRAVIALKLKADHNQKRFVGLPCFQPSCEKCLPTVKHRIYRRFQFHLDRLGDVPVYVSHILNSDWRVKRLGNKAGNFGRVLEHTYGSHDARYLVVSTEPIPVEGCTETSRLDALKTVDKAVFGIHAKMADFSKQRPFVFCREWGAELQEEEQPGEGVKPEKRYEIDREWTSTVAKGPIKKISDLRMMLIHYGIRNEAFSFVAKKGPRICLDFTMPRDIEIIERLRLAIEFGSVNEAGNAYEDSAQEEKTNELDQKADAGWLAHDLNLSVCGSG